MSNYNFVIMGVCGSGKTTVAKVLCEKINAEFLEGDNFHPLKNKEKMNSGIPLNDEDRKPWLIALGKEIAKKSKTGSTVLACSALKKSYRDIIREYADIKFIFLNGSKELIEKRLRTRKGHFMNPALLDSQFHALEEPVFAIEVGIDSEVEEIVDCIVDRVFGGIECYL